MATHNIRARGAFTLVELLVVIVIIGLLAAMLLPAISQAREKARQTHCANNLHQFSVAIAMYKDDHNNAFPPWLSNLHPDPITKPATYLCKTDSTRGKAGSKPDSMPEDQQFPETDDTDINGSQYGRNVNIHACSYMYEMCAAPCSWDYAYHLGATKEEVDANADGVVTWCEAKLYQLQHGDTTQTPPKQAYDDTAFPIVRCFHHHDRSTIKVDIDGQVTPQGMTLNVAYAGNVFRAPLQWELKPIE